jgi:hypothetical protein
VLQGTGIRADLAVFDDCFYGVEIKSEADTLKRLPSQMEGYARYFDRTILIVAAKHLRELRGIPLHGAEVWRQDDLADWQLYSLGEQRRISGQWLQHLLNADEERRVVRSIDRQRLHLPDLDLDLARRLEFEKAFRKRYASTSDHFWNEVRGRRITEEDLRHLSRFHSERAQRRELEQEREQRWAGWSSALADLQKVA